jgi:hypothetical protein
LRRPCSLGFRLRAIFGKSSQEQQGRGASTGLAWALFRPGDARKTMPAARSASACCPARRVGPTAAALNTVRGRGDPGSEALGLNALTHSTAQLQHMPPLPRPTELAVESGPVHAVNHQVGDTRVARCSSAQHRRARVTQRTASNPDPGNHLVHRLPPVAATRIRCARLCSRQP